jgi:hypothetical protein
VSFLIADAFIDTPPWSIIREGNGQMSVQDIPAELAERLLSLYGGYIFGGGLCWGKVPTEGHVLPTNEELLGLLGVS